MDADPYELVIYDTVSADPLKPGFMFVSGNKMPINNFTLRICYFDLIFGILDKDNSYPSMMRILIGTYIDNFHRKIYDIIYELQKKPECLSYK